MRPPCSVRGDASTAALDAACFRAYTELHFGESNKALDFFCVWGGGVLPSKQLLYPIFRCQWRLGPFDAPSPSFRRGPRLLRNPSNRLQARRKRIMRRMLKSSAVGVGTARKGTKGGWWLDFLRSGLLSHLLCKLRCGCLLSNDGNYSCIRVEFVSAIICRSVLRCYCMALTRLLPKSNLFAWTGCFGCCFFLWERKTGGPFCALHTFVKTYMHRGVCFWR